MKKQFTFLLILHFFTTSYSQSFETKSGEELSVSKGSIYMRVLLTEGTDVYVYGEEYTTKKVNPSYSLYKYDKNMTKIYESNFNKYIGDRFVFYVQSLRGRIYLFSSEWKKGKYTVYGIEIDKNTGALIGEEKVLSSYSRVGKFDVFDYRIKPDADSVNWIISALNNNKDGIHFFTVVGLDLNNKLSLIIEPKNLQNQSQYFELEDFILEQNQTVVIKGKLYDIITKDKKREFVFNSFSIQRYDKNGKIIVHYKLNLSDKEVASCKLFKRPGSEELFLTGVYKSSSEPKQVAGTFFSKLDHINLNLSVSFDSEIGDGDISSRKQFEDFPGYNNFIIREPIIFENKGLIIVIAETYDFKQSGSAISYGKVNNLSNNRSVLARIYHVGDLLITVYDLKNQKVIKQYTILKKQIEAIEDNPNNEYPRMLNIVSVLSPMMYINLQPVAPFYASYSAGIIDQKLIIFFNDQKMIEEKSRKKVTYPDFYTSTLNCYMLDLTNNTLTKKEVGANTDKAVFMARYGVTHDHNIFFPAMRHTEELKGNCKLVRLTLKD